MNTKNLKAYAPKARAQFIDAIKKRAAQFGLYEDKIANIQFEGGAAIIEGRAFTKKQGDQRKRLERKIDEKPLATHKERYDLFIREMAYTWFNRLAAIRYMELHDYFDHGFRVLSHPHSHPHSQNQLPEILDNAADVADMLALDKSHIIELQLAGDKEEELYRELLLGQCHYLYKVMPFMFEQLDDATELLLPDKLTKTDSILKDLISEIPEADWSKIEVIGWLYQFYISEHKNTVIGKVVKSEDIPAATQLFTPNWIVKYLVQNSLGRQWLATYPDSELKAKMAYYIEPAEQSAEVIAQLKTITPTSINPEQIKVLDPAVGSGHILVEVYDVLREIYLERGYRLREIPELILTKNIYGLDIDDRAAQLAGFALMMKAREDDRRIFQRVENGEVALNVYSLQSTEGLDLTKLWQALNLEGNQKQGSTGGLFDEPANVIPSKAGIYKDFYELLQTLKSAFLQAKTLGSLIQIDNVHLKNLVALKALLKAKAIGSDPSSKKAANDLLPIVSQAICLAYKYDAVVANPPYMGTKGMNAELKEFAKNKFPNSKSDLFAIFMERGFGLLKDHGLNAQVNMQSWMFLSSYESFREWLLDTKTFVTMAHLGARAFGQISGEVVQTTAWVLKKEHVNSYQPVFFRLIDGNEDEKREALLNKENRFDHTKQSDFKKIPGSPIAYWVTSKMRNIFTENKSIIDIADPKQGLATGENDRFLRLWHEISIDNLFFDCSSSEDSEKSIKKWYPCQKGGRFRRWYGNNQFVVNWKKNGKDLKDFKPKSVIRNPQYYYRDGGTWSSLSSGGFSMRYSPKGFIFESKGSICFTHKKKDLPTLISLANSSVVDESLLAISPTLDYHEGPFGKVPFVRPDDNNIEERFNELVSISKLDWDSFEQSWDFKESPLVKFNFPLISECLNQLIVQSKENTKRLSKLEKENDDCFRNAFGLPESNITIPENKISLLRNIFYKYKTRRFRPELDDRFCSECKSELITYSIGCMMGRYSLDREGLVYANSGNEGFKELVAEGAYKTFPADDDGIVPLASEYWLFDDDATTRFKAFVKTVWGDDNLQKNLEFVAESLCLHTLKPVKGESTNDTVRRYFSKQFYKDHCKTYKKRPIYWLFSSGKEKAFECLVYLHRYNESTLARMRTEYVTPLMGKYQAQHLLLVEQKIEASTTEARRIEKELKSLEKKQTELCTFDEQLKHYAEMRITLDLDDGVKANYGKFGNLLADVKAIHGKQAEVLK